MTARGSHVMSCGGSRRRSPVSEPPPATPTMARPRLRRAGAGEGQPATSSPADPPAAAPAADSRRRQRGAGRPPTPSPAHYDRRPAEHRDRVTLTDSLRTGAVEENRDGDGRRQHCGRFDRSPQRTRSTSMPGRRAPTRIYLSLSLFYVPDPAAARAERPDAGQPSTKPSASSSRTASRRCSLNQPIRGATGR